MRRIGLNCAIAAVTVVASQLPHAASAQPAPTAAAVRFEFTNGNFTSTTGNLVLRSAADRGGELTLVARDPGWALAFPTVCKEKPSDCPRAVLESDPAPWLNPDVRPVRWGASVLLPADQVSEGANVVQKGLSASGTQFKLQVDGAQGQPSCVVAGQENGSHRIFMALATQGIADGQWHNLGCERREATLRLVIDGQAAAEATLPATLSIVNELPLRLGGKGIGPNNDQFHGTLDDVFVEIG